LNTTSRGGEQRVLAYKQIMLKDASTPFRNSFMQGDVEAKERGHGGKTKEGG
jgi:hypothetical protein